MRHHYAEVLALEILIAVADREINTKTSDAPYSFFQSFVLVVEESREMYATTREAQGVFKKACEIAGKHADNAFQDSSQRQICNTFPVSTLALNAARSEVSAVIGKVFNSPED